MTAYLLQTTVLGRSSQQSQIHLPLLLTPLEYRLSLKLHFNETHGGNADGRVMILMKCLQPTDSIFLNANDLKIDRQNMELKEQISGERIRIKLLEHYPARQQIKLVIDSKLSVGMNYTLRVDYVAKIAMSEETGGLYLSGRKTKHVITQLQKVDASRVLPCFDEPQYRAHFVLSLLYPSNRNLTALSNAPELETTKLNDQWTQTTFESSPKMSTYLLAIYVGSLQFLETRVLGVTIRLFFANLDFNDAKDALDLIVQSFKFYTNYFNMSYPLSKLDVVVVENLRVVGMENWGLITLRYKELLIHDKRVLPIAHELSHMWGNMVAPSSHSELWLFEGNCERTIRKFLAFVENDEYVELDLEATALVKLLDNDFVYEPNRLHVSSDQLGELIYHEQNRLKNPVIYEKGSAFLGMLERTIGELNFDDAIRLFHQRYAFESADALDFGDCVDRVLNDRGNTVFRSVDLTAREFIDGWRKSDGFPLVIIEPFNETHSQVFSTVWNPLELTEIENSKQPWAIPLFLRSFDGNRREIRIFIPDSSDELYIPVDMYVEGGGCYRVMYKGELFERLLDDSDSLDAFTKTITMDNARAFAFNNLIPPSLLIQSIERLLNDRLPTALRIYIHTSSIFRYILEGHSKQRLLDGFLLKLGAKSYDEAEKTAYSNSLSYLEERRIQYLGIGFCSWSYKPCLQRALYDYKTMRNDCEGKSTSDECNTIPGPLRWSSYYTAVRNGNYEDLKFFKDQREYAKGDEMYRLTSAMIYTTNRTAQQEWLQSVMLGGCKVMAIINKAILQTPFSDSFMISTLQIFEAMEKKQLSSHVIESCGQNIFKYTMAELSRTSQDLSRFHSHNCTAFLSPLQCKLVAATIRTRIEFIKRFNVELHLIPLEVNNITV
ncbi:Aminopeptidase [Aphelenchoides besseyi]|nr:Aminopeptidase [Aphelenchoides besseyi]